MIERLKFRGKDIYSGDWYYGSDKPITGCSRWMHLSEFFLEDSEVKIDPATVGQWTGLKDSKGVEIYEGDIVESGNLRRWVIRWGSWKHVLPKYAYEQRFGWYLEGIESKDTVSLFPSDTLAVIGNIHDKEEK